MKFSTKPTQRCHSFYIWKQTTTACKTIFCKGPGITTWVDSGSSVSTNTPVLFASFDFVRDSHSPFQLCLNYIWAFAFGLKIAKPFIASAPHCVKRLQLVKTATTLIVGKKRQSRIVSKARHSKFLTSCHLWLPPPGRTVQNAQRAGYNSTGVEHGLAYFFYKKVLKRGYKKFKRSTFYDTVVWILPLSKPATQSGENYLSPTVDSSLLFAFVLDFHRCFRLFLQCFTQI